MRILHVTDRLSARGGADWHLLSVLRWLSEVHELLLLVGRDDGSASAPCPCELVAWLDDPRSSAADESMEARARELAQSLEAVAASFRPTVVHLHNALSPAVLSWAADHRAVMTVQDHRTFCPGQGKWTGGGESCRTPMGRAACASCFEEESYFEQIYRLTAERLAAVKRMSAVTVLSSYMKQELVTLGVHPPAGIHVIRPPVVGLDGATGPTHPDCVLFAGRLVRAKGVWDAVDAWRRAEVDLPLVFVGTGPERTALEREGFDVLGWVPHEQMAAVFRRARVLLLPSRWQEPFGIVGAEALSFGVPVVSWRSGGIAEWHPGPEAGALVEWGDVGALAAALRRWVASSAATPQLRQPAGFDTAVLMQRLLEVYGAVARVVPRDR